MYDIVENWELVDDGIVESDEFISFKLDSLSIYQIDVIG